MPFFPEISMAKHQIMLMTRQQLGCTMFYTPGARLSLGTSLRPAAPRDFPQAFGLREIPLGSWPSGFPTGQSGPWGVKHSASLLFSCHYISASLIAAVIADIIRYLLLFSYSRVTVGASARAQLQ